MTIDSLIKKVNKAHGEGTLVRGSDLKDLVIPRCTTGSLALDLMLGGGWPLNCWNEIVGEPSNGKSLIALKTIAANQAIDPHYEVLWVAAEDFVHEWAETCGVDLDRVTVSTTRVMEEAFTIVIDALDDRAVDAVVIDSLSALVPSDEDEKSMDEWLIGLGARITNKFMRKSASAQRRHLDREDRNCLGIVISQWREKVGVMFGDSRTTPYGRGKEFHYITRVEARRDEWIKSGKDERVGITMKARTIKNKMAPPQRVATVDFYWQDVPGFPAGEYDRVKEIINIAVAYDIIEQSGGWYTFDDQKWNGKDKLVASIREELDLQEKIDMTVREVVINGRPLGEVLEATRPKTVRRRRGR